MNYAEVLETVEEIAATSSTKAKTAIIANAVKDETFQKVMKAAYDPLVSYGIDANLPAGTMDGDATLEEPERWAVIEKLASRALTGDAAIAAIKQQLDELNEENAELLRRIIRKDMRAGFGDTLLNKAMPGLIPEFPYMRCSLFAKVDTTGWPWTEGVISQEKCDGSFANVNHEDDGTVTVRTRQGTAYPAGALGIEEDVKRFLLKSTQSHGELLVYEDGVCLPREEGNGVLNSLANGGTLTPSQHVHFFAWDQIPLSAVVPKGKYSIGYKKRLAALAKQVAASGGESLIHLAETRVVFSKAQAFEHYRALLRQGKEGTITKHPDAPWQDGTSKLQLKLKLEVDVDLEAVEVVPGRPGTKNENRPGSLRCRTSDDQLVVDVTIKNEAMRDEIEKDADSWLNKVYVVRANSVTEPGESNEKHSLYLPRFVEAFPRTDKRVADSLDQVKAQFEAAIA